MALFAIPVNRFSPSNKDIELIETLSFVTLLLAISVYSLMPIITRIVSAKLTSFRSFATIEEKFKLYFTKKIIVLAVMECPALFGLIVCLFGRMNNVMKHHPESWFNALPSLILLLYIAFTFPNIERVKTELQHEK
jgi:hypothetical protein